MLEERDGWFVVNVQAAHWWANATFGRNCSFEMRGRFEQTGIYLALLEPVPSRKEVDPPPWPIG